MKKHLMIPAVLCLILLVFSGCGSKTALSPAEFRSRAKAAGLTVTSSDSYDSSILADTPLAKSGDSALITAFNDDTVFLSSQQAESAKGWAIIYVQVDSEKEAQACFYRCKQFVSFGSGKSKSVEKDSYKMYSLTGGSLGSYFYYCCQIGDTLVYVSEPETEKEEIEKALKQIGY